MKKITQKTSIFLIAIFLVIQGASAQSVLTELPFGIVIGQTTNEEIENRGTCMVSVPRGAENMRCERYDLAGKFYVYSSQNEVVNKLEFNGDEGNVLPRKWRDLDMKFGGNGRSGTLDIDFMNIIKENGGNFIHTALKYNNKGEPEGTEITFDIEKLSYYVLIRTDPNKLNKLGLQKIVITEAY